MVYKLLINGKFVIAFWIKVAQIFRGIFLKWNDLNKTLKMFNGPMENLWDRYGWNKDPERIAFYIKCGFWNSNFEQTLILLTKFCLIIFCKSTVCLHFLQR